MEEKELERYIELFRGTVYRLAFSWLKNREDAEDISQDAFLKLYTSKESFACDENVKAWLIRVTVNLCKNLLKSSWRKNRAESFAEEISPPPDELHIDEYIARLKPEYSSVLYLFYYEGYSVKEIAEICRLTSVAVRTRLSRGRDKLKEMLLKEDTL